MANSFEVSSISSSSSLDESFSTNASPSVQMVSKSASERLLRKFFDASQYDFNYEQSGLWSPPIPRRAFLASPAGNVYYEDELFCKLKKAKKACRRRIGCFNKYLNNTMTGQEIETWSAICIEAKRNFQTAQIRSLAFSAFPYGENKGGVCVKLRTTSDSSIKNFSN